MTARKYDTAAAFKQALEQRLRTTSASGLDFSRRRQLIVFDRFLARVGLELGEPEFIVADDALAFAGIAPPVLRVYPVETHIAEKLHAYTMPRSRPNSRVKDLPDLMLIATTGPLDARRVRAAIEQTFAFRSTHEVPARLSDPPASWEAPYAAIAEEDRLRWTTLGEAVEAARVFLDPVLAGGSEARWDHDAWGWSGGDG